ncbi:hypothetical protein ACWD4N_00390 [Streptomyces sp. NPDC002586]
MLVDSFSSYVSYSGQFKELAGSCIHRVQFLFLPLFWRVDLAATPGTG